MHSAFSHSVYMLRRKGLAIVGNCHLLEPDNDEPLAFMQEKMKGLPPSRTWHIYADEDKRREILTLKDSAREDVDLDVTDPKPPNFSAGCARRSTTRPRRRSTRSPSRGPAASASPGRSRRREPDRH